MGHFFPSVSCQRQETTTIVHPEPPDTLGILATAQEKTVTDSTAPPSARGASLHSIRIVKFRESAARQIPLKPNGLRNNSRNRMCDAPSRSCTIPGFLPVITATRRLSNRYGISSINSTLILCLRDMTITMNVFTQTPDGTQDPARGLREFVVGTGGAALRNFNTPEPQSEIRNSTHYGVLKLTLHSKSYDWEFLSSIGDPAFSDRGTAGCH